jgi:nicotinate-nucleotide pyrophosphorylase (carboxylating)
MDTSDFIRLALAEDIGLADHTSLATIPKDKNGRALLLVKEEGVLSGLTLAEEIFRQVDPELELSIHHGFKDGCSIVKGDVLFEVNGSIQSILKAERLVLNCLQRLSGIASVTNRYVRALDGTRAVVLDTRKTTPLLRKFEKEAVVHGGGRNHRTGLYDMILIKDNHVDAAGGIEQALTLAKKYCEKNNLTLPIEIETRNIQEIEAALKTGIAHRIMFDNFSPEEVKAAVSIVDRKAETEASGGITIDNIRRYGESGIDFISVGALTHSVKSIDLSLKLSL